MTHENYSRRSDGRITRRIGSRPGRKASSQVRRRGQGEDRGEKAAEKEAQKAYQRSLGNIPARSNRSLGQCPQRQLAETRDQGRQARRSGPRPATRRTNGTRAGHEPNADQIAYWNGPGGQHWTDRQQTQDAVLAPVADALIERAGPKGRRADCRYRLRLRRHHHRSSRKKRSPTAVCSASTFRRRCWPRARQIAPANLPLDFINADATVYPFEPSSFDLLASRFGVMFFADPALFLHQFARRRCGPSGRLAFSCWREPRENPFLSWRRCRPPTSHVAKLPPLAPDDPGPFSFASRGARHRVFWTRPDFTGHCDGDVAICSSILQSRARSGGCGRIPHSKSVLTARALSDQPPELRSPQPPNRSARRWTPFVRGQAGGLLPASIWIVTARAS